MDKDQPELLEQVNAFIAEIMENGTFEEICNKYFGDGTPTAVASAELDPNKDQLLVATNAAFEPFEYKDGDMYYGIDMEIAKLLADKLGKELVIQNMDFDAVCLSVGQHQSDIAMAGLTINETREQYVTFATPYYKASQKLIVPSNDTRFDDCKTVEDIEAILKEMDKNTKIGVQNGTTGQKYLVGDADWGFEGFNVDCSVTRTARWRCRICSTATSITSSSMKSLPNSSPKPSTKTHKQPIQAVSPIRTRICTRILGAERTPICPASAGRA